MRGSLPQTADGGRAKDMLKQGFIKNFDSK
jgi:hypothetical protein